MRVSGTQAASPGAPGSETRGLAGCSDGSAGASGALGRAQGGCSEHSLPSFALPAALCPLPVAQGLSAPASPALGSSWWAHTSGRLGEVGTPRSPSQPRDKHGGGHVPLAEQPAGWQPHTQVVGCACRLCVVVRCLQVMRVDIKLLWPRLLPDQAARRSLGEGRSPRPALGQAVVSELAGMCRARGRESCRSGSLPLPQPAEAGSAGPPCPSAWHPSCLLGVPNACCPSPRIYDQRKIDENENNGVLKKFCPHHLVSGSIWRCTGVMGGTGGPSPAGTWRGWASGGLPVVAISSRLPAWVGGSSAVAVRLACPACRHRAKPSPAWGGQTRGQPHWCGVSGGQPGLLPAASPPVPASAVAAAFARLP